jgi:predicted TIM-barrel fold metal-dependent hydrolase
MLCDAHVHFFSPAFFAALAAQGQVASADALRHLGWDDPVSIEELADRWVAEMDVHGVGRAAVIASIPGDEESVALAAARHPQRLVGYCMIDPTKNGAENRVVTALDRGLRGICLFPAMQRFSLHDERVGYIAEILASHGSPATRPVLFAHCGMLSVGARTKLGLPSRFDMTFGNPLDLHWLALRFPEVPFVVPHFGAGLFREALMVADASPNVYFDSSSSNAWVRYTPGLTLEQVFATTLEIVGPARVLFGTDSSFFPRGWHRAVYERQSEALQAAGASTADIRAIMGGNFERLHATG